jgi:transposase
MQQQRQYVGIDLHRRRSVIVRVDEHGEHVSAVRIDNDPITLAAEVAKAGEQPEVVLEATYGWYWAVDVLEELGATVHLAHPSGLNWGQRRRKDDERDATDLVDMLRLGRLPEAWIAPPATRELRELVRYRAKLVCLRSGLKAQVHAVLAKEGVHVAVSDLFGVGGQRLLDEVPLGRAYTIRVESLRDLIELYDREITMAEREVRAALDGHKGWAAVQAIPGVGPVLGAVFVAEIDDVDRFPTARHLCSWAGLTPKHHESDTTVIKGRITKQGSRLVRWAAVEAAQKTGGFLNGDFRRIAERRNNRKIARVAVARKILTLVYYGLRDGEIRCLAQDVA